MSRPRRQLKAFGYHPIALTGTRLSVLFPRFEVCRAKGNRMRTLVQPPRTLHCDFCHGELRLKQSDQGGPFFEFNVNTLVCIKCGHETSYRMSHDRYAAPRASNIPPTTVG